MWDMFLGFIGVEFRVLIWKKIIGVVVWKMLFFYKLMVFK